MMTKSPERLGRGFMKPEDVRINDEETTEPDWDELLSRVKRLARRHAGRELGHLRQQVAEELTSAGTVAALEGCYEGLRGDRLNYHIITALRTAQRRLWRDAGRVQLLEEEELEKRATKSYWPDPARPTLIRGDLRLTPKERSAVMMLDKGYEIKEIASHMGVSTRRVYQLLQAVKKKSAARLQK